MEEKTIKEKNEKCACEKESRISIGWLIAGILLIAIIAVVALLGFKSNINIAGYNLAWSKTKVLNAADAQTKVSDYINNEVLAGKTKAEISSLTEQNGVYIFKVTVQGQSFDSYVSKDGSILFPEGMAMTAATGETAAATTEIPKVEKATTYLFTMSYCPYGNEAETAMKPVVDLLKDKAVVEPHYIVSKSDAGYASLHGEQELNEDVREICIYKYQPDKYWSFIEAVNDACTSKNVDTCWEAVAKTAGIDTAKIATCQTDEADTLLAKELALSTKYNVTGSPSLVINDTVYTGGRSAQSYKTGICSGFTTAPTECSQDLASSSTTATNTNASCAN